MDVLSTVRWRARGRCAPMIALAMLLSACGGGGESSSPAPTNPPVSPPVTPPVNPPVEPPAPSPATVTFTATAVAVSGNNRASGLTIEDRSIGLTVANRPATGLWTRIFRGNAPVQRAAVEWSAPGVGTLRLDLPPPMTMAAGVFTGTMQVEVCLDAACAQQVAGSPVEIDVTYTVTGAALPATALHWVQGLITDADLNTAETRAPRVNLRLSTTNLAYDGIYLRRSRSVTGLITDIVFGEPTFTTSIGTAFGQYDITLQSPASLGSGIFTDVIAFEACFDAACASVVPNSRHTLAIEMLVEATEGVEFIRRTLTTPNGATEVVWSPGDASLYLAASAHAGNGPIAGLDPRILRVDPVTMTTGPAITLPGENLQHLAVSADATYLYAGSKTQPVVHRLRLPTLLPDLAVPLGYFSASTPYLVNDLAVVPGQPGSFVVAVKHNSSHGGVFVYDDATARPGTIGTAPAQAFEHARWLVPAAVSGTFLSQNYGPSQPVVNRIEQLTLDAAGISTSVSTPSASGLVIGQKPQRAGTRLYTVDGRVLDAGTGALIATLALPDSSTPFAVLADEARGRLFVWMTVRQRELLLSYDLATLELLALTPVYAPPASPSGPSRSMVLWGSDGLALTDGSQLVVLSGRFFSTYRGEPAP